MFPRYFSGEITNWPRLPCYSLNKSRMTEKSAQGQVFITSARDPLRREGTNPEAGGSDPKKR